MKKYDHLKIEKKWQKEWEKAGIYKVSDETAKPKCYVLDMFPYPSGDGLHVGHPKGYIATDIYSRFKKMNGMNVLHPMGWDAFGLPAEQYAIKNKVHPSLAVQKNVARFKEQLSIIGLNYDWSREVNTTDPKYYKWTQWVFLKLLEKGLAYESYEPITWCPSCQTGLAAEDLEGDKCERCGTVVEKKPMRQWVLRITDYADRMLADLDKVDWADYVKDAQRNWIGRSEGALLKFEIRISKSETNPKTEIQNIKRALEVFTTRPDTLFGATYCVLSPEHKLVDELKDAIENFDEVKEYRAEAKAKTEIERLAEGKEKTGMLLKGIKAVNPVNDQELPVYIADYVLAHYGTGAIMAVPAHDTRDYEFAKKFGIEVKKVIRPTVSRWLVIEKSLPEECNQELSRFGKVDVQKIDKNWGRFFVVNITEKEDEFVGWLKENLIKTSEDGGSWYANSDDSRRVVFFGADFDVSDGVGMTAFKEYGRKVGVPEEQLDINNLGIFAEYGVLVNSGNYSGMESSEAKKAITGYVGGKLTSTYKLRDWVFSRQRYWGEPIPVVHCEKDGVVPVPESELPVKLPEVEFYEPTGTGESPLANVTEWVETKCPKCGGPAKRETNTMPQWAGSCWYYLRYIDPKNGEALVGKEKEKYWSPVDMYVGGMEHATRHLIYARFWHKFLYDIGVVNYPEPFAKLHTLGLILASDGRKMSKRWGNVVNPDEIVETYGADTLRLYEMFMGPFEQASAWSTESIIGPRRFLEKVWNIVISTIEPTDQNKETVMAGYGDNAAASTKGSGIEASYHKMLRGVSLDIENFKFNTAISKMMIFVNELEKENKVSQEIVSGFLRVLAPFAPHIAEELWHETGNKSFIYEGSWPIFDAEKAKEETIVIAVQISGKVRTTFEISAETDEEEVKSTALSLRDVKKWIDGKEVKKVIYVKGKLLSIVV